MSFAFNDQQRKTLQLICEAFNPSLSPLEDGDHQAIFENHAGLYPIIEHLEKTLAQKPEEKQKQISFFLSAINFPFLCWYLTHRFVPFRMLDLNSRVKVLRFWRDNRRAELRTLFQLFKRTTLFLSYGLPIDETEDGKTNPTWQAVEYTGKTPLIAQDASTSNIQFATLTGYQEEIECDYLIIGSGAGGAVMAAELAEKPGNRILVVEKAQRVPPADLGVGEFDGIAKYYDGGGSLATEDLGVTILSGSTVGGGTTINWMTCLDPPESILNEWATKYGVSNVLKERYRTSLMAVRRRLNVNDINSKLNKQNELLFKGCEHFGFAHQLIQRNAMDCGDCGFCGFGCRAGAKQDTRQTYLADASRLGVEILDGCEVQTIERDGHKATHAIAQVRQPDGDVDTIRIKFRAAIVACGTIQSAALLLRSGFENPHIGQNLKLHPTTAVAAFYDTPIYQWKGAPQTIVCNEFENLDGRHHGVRLETAPCHPGYGAMALAWNGPLQHKRLMCHFHRMANTVIIGRDSGSGKVTIDEFGKPVIQYQLNELDEQNLMFGVERSLEIHRAMGAKTLVSPLQKYATFTHNQSNQEFNQALVDMEHMGGRSNSLALFSAHQMSTIRMADSPLRGAVDRKGRCFDAQNVYVCDASIFPTAVGVNPMITIMSMSHMLSQTIRDEGFSVYDF